MDVSDEQMERAKAFAKRGAVLAGIGAGLVTSRTIAWGVLGLILSAAAGAGLLAAGALEVDPGFFHPVGFKALVIGVCLVASVLGMGYIGAIRGFGRVILMVGVKEGFVVFLAEEILDQMAAQISSSARAGDAMSRADVFLKNLPLQTWEDTLKRAVGEVAEDSNDEVMREARGLRARVLGRVRSFLCEKIEKYLLVIVRAELEQTEDGAQGGGISLARVREIGLVRLEALFAELVEGMMNRPLYLGLAALVVLHALGPLLAYRL